MSCEDYPCCGHEFGDCEGLKYGSDESIKNNPHLLCDHEIGECELAWDDPNPISAPDDLNTETPEWRDADALGDPDHEYDLAFDREMEI